VCWGSGLLCLCRGREGGREEKVNRRGKEKRRDAGEGKRGS